LAQSRVAGKQQSVVVFILPNESSRPDSVLKSQQNLEQTRRGGITVAESNWPTGKGSYRYLGE
jgi:hypothetical protein